MNLIQGNVLIFSYIHYVIRIVEEWKKIIPLDIYAQENSVCLEEIDTYTTIIIMRNATIIGTLRCQKNKNSTK